MRLVLVAEIRLVQVAEMRLVQVAEMTLVQVAEIRLVPWAPPAFLEGGGWRGQNRASKRHLTATNMLSAFSGFQPGWGGGGGGGGGGEGCCLLSADSTSGGGEGCCLLSADSTSGGGGGGGGAVRFWLIQPARGGALSTFGCFNQRGGGAVCLLSAFG